MANRIFLLVVLVFFINTPFNASAQHEGRISRAYIAGMLHDSQIGLSLTNSFGISKYFGIGAGVDLTSYDSKTLVPLYLDVRGRYKINQWEPFVYTQFGKNLYKKSNAFTYVDITGQGFKYDKNGKLFYGAGAGISYKIGNVAIFASYTYRGYIYKFSGAQNATSQMAISDQTVNANIASIGIML